jgi:hypothetical protein
MPESAVLLVCTAILVVGSGLVAWYALSAHEAGGRSGRHGRGDAIDYSCASCNKPLVIGKTDLTELSRPEMALAVRVRSDLTGRKLAEYVCPYCEASHCFAVDGRRIEWVGVNMYSPHTTSARCMDCGKTLRTPPWPAGTYDGRLNEAPSLQPDYGLICSKCHAVVCFACTQLATRGRTKDGSFVCPRCQRSPVDRSYHPT